MTEPKCGCGGSTKLVFPCSGGSDVGELTDRAARQLSKTGEAKMSCLAGVGGGISGFIASAQGADVTLVLDGCPQDCGKKTMEKNGLTGFKHLRLNDCGYQKGKSPATEQNITAVCMKAGEHLVVPAK